MTSFMEYLSIFFFIINWTCSPFLATPSISRSRLKIAKWNDLEPSAVVSNCWYFDPHNRSNLTILLTYNIRLAVTWCWCWVYSVPQPVAIIDDAVCSKLKMIWKTTNNWIFRRVNHKKEVRFTWECYCLQPNVPNSSIILMMVQWTLHTNQMSLQYPDNPTYAKEMKRPLLILSIDFDFL